SGYAFNSISNSIKDAYFGKAANDWIGQYNEMRLASQKRATQITDALWDKINSADNSVTVKKETFTGTFTDPLFGEVTIEKKGDQLYFRAHKAPKLQGPMYFYKGNTFIVKWNDRTLDADAFVMFNLDQE